MKKWMKKTLPAGAALAAGIGAFSMFSDVDETNAYRNYETTGNAAAAAKSNGHAAFTEAEGKVTSISKRSITIDVPFQGKKTFSIDDKTRIKKKLHLPLKKGTIAEIDANGKQAYEIETERSIDAHGTIVSITNKAVTLEQNGKRETFAKASRFKIDSDEYQGALEGVPAEISLNAKNQITELEIEMDDDDNHDDD